MTRNITASIRQKLLNFSEKTGDDPNLIWSRYAVERLLYRLSVSEFSKDFVLKGAALFIIWAREIYRPTMDLDLLGYCEPSSERMENVFRKLCLMDVVNDGLEFDEKSVRVVEVREEAEYHGCRIKLVAHLGKARIPVQVDIGFGDAITPKAELVNYPSILDLPAPRIWAYPRPTVIAEKLYAMVTLGIANSRMKDFYDLYTLGTCFEFEGRMLVKAVKATFQRRLTKIPSETPLALTEHFSQDHIKNKQWNAFIHKNSLEENAPVFLDMLVLLREFLVPVIKAAAGRVSIPGHWKIGGPWSIQNRQNPGK